MAEKKKAAPKKAAPKKTGTWKIRQKYPNSVGAVPQLLPVTFKSEKEAEAYIKDGNWECCTVVKVD